jgi:hypothetical protein
MATQPIVNSFRHISEVSPVSADDGPLMKELGAVLKKYNALDRFGITLLHKHFNLEASEVLVEETDILTRTQTVKPVAEADIAGEPAIETAWCLNDIGQPIMSCKCLNRGGEHSGEHKPIHIAV